METIKITEEISQKLMELSQHYKDEPSYVIERLINYYEGKGFVNGETKDERPQRDYGQIIYKGNKHNKRRFVLTVVKDYVNEHSPISFAELSKVFPKNIQGGFGVIQKSEAILPNYTRRYFAKKDEIITLSDCKIAVCDQWGRGINIERFIEHIRTELGITIEWSD